MSRGFADKDMRKIIKLLRCGAFREIHPDTGVTGRLAFETRLHHGRIPGEYLPVVLRDSSARSGFPS
ncbi:hypothetical protein MesoLjLc_32320 [Mesorhizobium sp. L-8-10]|nr:hypothetical protein MesoLjLb_33530 [Mesorhizobium sp. L-8-3]BCH31302.1 hypothetical protein MesoLjLc_32320 [Mesorhizobium sp. L-8-10]